MSVDTQPIDTWCREVLGASVSATIFSRGRLAQVIGVQLDDGRKVVVKLRPASPRLAAVVSTQRHLHQSGVPCPRPLAGPLPFRGQAITADSYVPADQLPGGVPPADACAELLAAIVAAGPPASAVAELNPAPPWVGWDHPGDQTWPPPDDLDADLNRSAASDWLDAAARRVRQALLAHASAPVVGHVDWEAHNMGWDGESPIVVYDWDSLAIRTEPTIVGAAATVFASTTGRTVAASVSDTATFLDSYQRRREPFPAEDMKAAWAAGLWTLLYNAKKETAGGGGGYLKHLEAELEQRMRLAGL